MSTDEEKQSSDETFILLIWEEIPETTKLVLIPASTVSQELEDLLESVHNCYGNMVGNTEEETNNILCLTNALASDEFYLNKEIDPKWNQILTKYIVDDGSGTSRPIHNKIRSVYRTGWLL